MTFENNQSLPDQIIDVLGNSLRRMKAKAIAEELGRDYRDVVLTLSGLARERIVSRNTKGSYCLADNHTPSDIPSCSSSDKRRGNKPAKPPSTHSWRTKPNEKPITTVNELEAEVAEDKRKFTHMLEAIEAAHEKPDLLPVADYDLKVAVLDKLEALYAPDIAEVLRDITSDLKRYATAAGLSE